MSSLPEELYHEILVRLPGKSLLRCKCVRKSWFKLISDSKFVKSHLNFTIQKNNPSFMLKGLKNNYVVINSMEYDSLSLEVSDINEMDYPFFKSQISSVKLVGSCNGLVCIRINNLLCIWNPTTNENKILPQSPNSYQYLYGQLAFGYDCKSDDYKCVHLKVIEDQQTSSVEVYTLGSNSWKSSQAISYSNHIGCSAELINGALHWLCRRNDDYDYSELLISFDINTGKLTELQLPRKSLETYSWFSDVGLLKGCLCVLVKDVRFNFEVWVMHDYGVQESWKKITIRTRFTNSYPYRRITSLKNGKIVIVIGGNLVIYDPEEGSAKELNFSSSVYFTSGVPYFETLVSPNSGTYSGLEARKEGSFKTRKRKWL